MSLLKLRLSMVGTLALIIAVSTLAFALIMSLMGTFDLISLAFTVIIFNLIQWLFAPYLIDAMYSTHEISRSENPRLYGIVERLSSKASLKMPKLMLANIPIPNAFAYGSPISGSRVAVTKGLLNELEEEEVEAVIGHELGHLKHKDVQIMMFVSVLPAIFYFIGYSMMMSAQFGIERRREGGGAIPVLVGLVSMVIYWILTLFALSLSRLREYYADRHSASIVDEGPRKLSEALAKIVSSNAKIKRDRREVSRMSSFKTLFIEDPDRAESDAVKIAQARSFRTDQELVREVMSRKISTVDRVLELLSSHPNIVKRLKALQQI
ncbi:MAG: zinc metalloprotease HtpX [Candidatus Bathyarchaeia archaeon]